MREGIVRFSRVCQPFCAGRQRVRGVKPVRAARRAGFPTEFQHIQAHSDGRVRQTGDGPSWQLRHLGQTEGHVFQTGTIDAYAQRTRYARLVVVYRFTAPFPPPLGRVTRAAYVCVKSTNARRPFWPELPYLRKKKINKYRTKWSSITIYKKKKKNLQWFSSFITS